MRLKKQHPARAQVPIPLEASGRRRMRGREQGRTLQQAPSNAGLEALRLEAAGKRAVFPRASPHRPGRGGRAIVGGQHAVKVTTNKSPPPPAPRPGSAAPSPHQPRVRGQARPRRGGASSERQSQAPGRCRPVRASRAVPLSSATVKRLPPPNRRGANPPISHRSPREEVSVRGAWARPPQELLAVGRGEPVPRRVPQRGAGRSDRSTAAAMSRPSGGGAARAPVRACLCARARSGERRELGGAEGEVADAPAPPVLSGLCVRGLARPLSALCQSPPPARRDVC